MNSVCFKKHMIFFRSCGLHCKMPLVQDSRMALGMFCQIGSVKETTTGSISIVAMKLALEALQQEKDCPGTF